MTAGARIRRLALVPVATALLPACEVQLGHVDFLWALWLVPMLIAFQIFVFRRKTILLHRFVSAELAARLTEGVSRTRQMLKATLLITAVGLTVVALAEIRYGFVWEDVKRHGVDIVLALDVSDSMLVQDAEAGGELTRLERAKREVTDLLRLLEGDRIGLVAFAGVAFVECPLTLDYTAAEIFLDDIDTELIPVKGTALGEAIRVSLKAFEGSAQDSRAIILITDGEDHSGEALAAAEEAKVQGVRIFPIGIGRDEGSPIPVPGGGFRRDRRGEVIMSKLDEPTLQKIALATGGRYVRSVTGDIDLEQIYTQGIKATLVDHELSSKRRQRWEERFQWVLALCLILLAVEPFIRERGNRVGAAAGALLLLALFSPAVASAQPAPAPQPTTSAGSVPQPAAPIPPVDPGPAPATPERIDNPHTAFDVGSYDQALQGFVDLQVEHPHDPELMLSIGSAHFKMKNYEEAERAYASAGVGGDEKLRARAFYNLGNVAYRQGKLEEAIKRYQAALELDPNDEDAKFNIEFVRDEIRRRHEEAQKRQEQGDQQQQQGDKQQQNDQQEQQQNQSGGSDGADEKDSDGDGLSDQLEQSAQNKTDPHNPDSDGDGLPDGREDINQNGRVDKGETDPNKKDTDGDGVDDGAEAAAQQQQQPEQDGLSPEEAERYLQGLDDDRPRVPHRKARGRRRPAKDW